MSETLKDYRTFVTVGTHEQPFDRLVSTVDRAAKNSVLPNPIFIQTGYSSYKPKHCDWSPFITPEEMTALIRKSDIVVTHGGPSSYLNAIANGKTPIVVPRRAAFGEHINDHQSVFAQVVEERMGGIVVLEDLDDLAVAVENAVSSCSSSFQSNNKSFCSALEELVYEMFAQ